MIDNFINELTKYWTNIDNEHKNNLHQDWETILFIYLDNILSVLL